MAKKGKRKKLKSERECYNCKHRWNCKDKFTVNVLGDKFTFKSICDKFKFDATSKSI